MMMPKNLSRNTRDTGMVSITASLIINGCLGDKKPTADADSGKPHVKNRFFSAKEDPNIRKLYRFRT